MSTLPIRLAIAGPNGRMGQELLSCLTRNDAASIQLGGLLFRDLDKMTRFQSAYPELSRLCYSDLNLLLRHADILIDFTSPQATQQHLAICLSQSKALVIGTTGLNKAEQQAIQLAAQHIPIVSSANFSIGINVMFSLLKRATQVLAERSDIEIIESHHRNKVDAPSGTALAMGHCIANTLGVDLEKIASYTAQGNVGARQTGTIGFSSIRGGDIIGDHTALFLSEGESVAISHHASQRAIFAQGAIYAARWLASKSAGYYSMQDVLGLETL